MATEGTQFLARMAWCTIQNTTTEALGVQTNYDDGAASGGIHAPSGASSNLQSAKLSEPGTKLIDAILSAPRASLTLSYTRITCACGQSSNDLYAAFFRCPSTCPPDTGAHCSCRDCGDEWC
ncbi:hypothetical protein VTP01DRAFT_5589 [Rhizomucor pusillus]|uniref:uncharacterized protein n=1 Tax=Rhizomucor pusillus TaxID=4840 RepID=UPI0037447750